jgi:SM-20-related protein
VSAAGNKIFVSKVPPFVLRRDFLHPDLVRDLLAFVDANQVKFVPSRVGYGEQGLVDARSRISLVYPEVSPLAESIGRQMAPLKQVVCEMLGEPDFALDGVEVELAAHNDGAFYGRHSDVRAPGPRGQLRKLSGVFYFHARPQAFSGGALRIYDPSDPTFGRAAEVDPIDNSCVFFPPRIPHEVMRVSCPSRRFMDSRFALNFWYVGF